MSILHVHVIAAYPCRCYMSMSVLHVHVTAACPCGCCMSLSMQHDHFNAAPGRCFISMIELHVHGRAACPCFCMSMMYFSISMSMLHVMMLVHNECPFCMPILHANTALQAASMLHVHSACVRILCCLSMLYFQAVWSHFMSSCAALDAGYYTCDGSEMIVHNNSVYPSASTNAVITFAVALDAGYHTCTGIWDNGI